MGKFDDILKLYTGSTEITKLYKGSTVVFQEEEPPVPVGPNIYVEDGKLVFPEGLPIKLLDHTASEDPEVNPVFRDFSLPETFAFEGQESTTFSLGDSCYVSVSPYLEGGRYIYQQSAYCQVGDKNSDGTDATDTRTFTKLNYGDIGMTFSYTGPLSAGSTNRAGLFSFKATMDSTWFAFELHSFFAAGYLGAVLGGQSKCSFYLHDYGEGSDLIFPQTGQGLISSNDVQLKTYDRSSINGIYATESKDGLVKEGHIYGVYVKSSSYATASYDAVKIASDVDTSRLILSRTVEFQDYDKFVNVIASGFYFGSSDVMIRIADEEPYSEGEKIIGKAKYNPERGWYEAVPAEDDKGYTLVGENLTDENGIISGFDGTNQVEIDSVPITLGKNIISFLYLPNETGTYEANQHLIRYGLKEGFEGANNACQFRFTSSKNNSIWCRVGSADSVYFTELTADNQPLYGAFVLDVTEESVKASAYYSRTGLDSLAKCSNSFTFAPPDFWENRKWIFGQGSTTSFLLGKIDMNYVSIQNGEGETWGTNFPEIPTAGAGISVKDGNLIIPQGLTINIEDYSAGGLITTPYALPEEALLTDASPYETTFSDGTHFMIYPSLTGTTYEYQENLTYRIGSEDYAVPVTVTGSVNYLETKGVGKSQANEWGYNVTADIFAFECTKDCNYFRIEIKYFYPTGVFSTLASKAGVSGIYIHDHGEVPLKGLSLFYTYPSGKKDESDVSLDFSTVASYNVSIAKNQEGLLKAGHTYSVYLMGSNKTFLDFNGYTTGGSSGYTFGTVTIRKDVPYDNYNKSMYVTGMGYSFGGTKDVNINISDREPHPEYGEISLGTAKYNPDQGWYEATPAE